jgi:phage gp29-like protein
MTAALQLSPWTGRPLPPTSTLALARIAAAGPLQAARGESAAMLPPDLERIIRPQAMTRWILPQLAAITPAYIEQTLRGAFTGSHIQQWELFDLMEDTWPRLLKNLGEVKRAVAGLDWKLQPWAEEDTPPTDEARERAKLVSNAVWRMRPDPCCDENGFTETIRDLLDAWGKGTSVLEILWEIRNAGVLGDITAPRATAWVHPSAYGWDTEGRLGLNYAQLERSTFNVERSTLNVRRSTYNQANAAFPASPGDLGPFPEDKFIVAIFKAKTGSPLTTALLRPLAWWWCAANFSADWLMNLAQLFGLPFRWANYADGAPQATVSKICSMLENMGSAGWAAFPTGTTLELKDTGKTGDNSPQADLLDRADKNCDLLILGQTLTSDTGGMGSGSGSMALGKVHSGVRSEVIEGVAGFAATVLNQQLVPAILRQNYGNEEQPPEFRPESEKEIDQKANADRDAVLIAAGVEMPKQWFYKRHDIPLPTEGEEIIGKPEPEPLNVERSTFKEPGAGARGEPGEEEPIEDNAEVQASEGRWVTISGTPVFIKEGQSVDDAVKQKFGGDTPKDSDAPKPDATKPEAKREKITDKRKLKRLNIDEANRLMRQRGFEPVPGSGRTQQLPDRSWETSYEYKDAEGKSHRFTAAKVKEMISNGDDEPTKARRAQILSAIRARFASPSTRREQRELDSLARALARDLAPIRARVAAILKIQDETIFKSKLADFNADLDSLKADMARDPAMASELEKIIAAAFANGLSQPNRQ